MGRPRRIKFTDPETGAYHIISRALQKEYRFNEAEKAKFLALLQWLSQVYFVRIATFSLMTTHIHLVVKMIRKSDISEDELKRRYDLYYNRFATDETKRLLTAVQIPAYYERFSDVSRFMQDLKQRFSRWYNEVHDGCGHVWSERFKSVLLVGPRAIRACMIYVELNALRAKIVREPEKYPYCGLYYYHKGIKHSAWLDHTLLEEVLDHHDHMLKLAGVNVQHRESNLESRYLKLVYQEGMNFPEGKGSVLPDQWDTVRKSVYLTRISHFTRGIILGSKEDCESQFEKNIECFRTERKREANPVIKAKSKKGVRKKKEPDEPTNSAGKRWVSDLFELFSIRSFSSRV